MISVTISHLKIDDAYELPTAISFFGVKFSMEFTSHGLSSKQFAYLSVGNKYQARKKPFECNTQAQPIRKREILKTSAFLPTPVMIKQLVLY